MYSESEMPYEEMQRAVNQGYLCAECQNTLTIAWGGAYGINSYVLRCGNDASHKGITRHDKKYEQKLKEGFSMDSNALMTMDEAKMLQRVEMARFPQDLTIADKKLLAQVAITYGFDPLMGEVTIYQGRPYVSIDGRYRKAQETGQLDGVETRPTTKQEREDWQIPEGDYFYRSEVYVKGSSRPFVAWGRVHGSETKPGSRKPGDTTSTFKPIQNNPQRMAEKRAEGQALRKAFHIPLPSVEDIGSPDYDVESTAVNVTTGEITEGKPRTQPQPTTKGEYAKKPQSQKTAVADGPEPENQPEMPPEDTESAGEPSEPEPSPIDIGWLRESLLTLQSKQLKAWNNANVVSYLNSITGQKSTSVSGAVKLLSKEEAEKFVAKIQEAIELA